MKLIKIIAALLLVTLCFGSAIAQTKGDKDTESAIIVEVQTTPRPTDAFNVEGNGSVTDEHDDSSKEFYIITTANNQTFYLIIDKAGTSQNVYLLSKVDENDLAEFIEDRTPAATPTPTPAPTIIIQKPAETPVVTDTPAASTESQADLNKLLLIGGVLAAGAFIYFKVIKPKQADKVNDEEGIEFVNGESEE